MRWDPAEYLSFADERGRPFADLLLRVGATSPGYVVDLGCGPGNLTRDLARRWPAARVEGVDSSPEMIARAAEEGGADQIRYAVGDLREWAPAQPVDVLVSNATLQWVPGHLDLLPRLCSFVAPGGWLAFQVPGNFAEPTHTELAAVRESDRWRPTLAPLDLPAPWSAEPPTYLEVLAGLGARVDVWETTYLQVLAGDDAVLRWMQGTGLRPVLGALDGVERQAFLDEYAERLRVAYPQQAFGTVLPYRRIFAVAQLGGSA